MKKILLNGLLVLALVLAMSSAALADGEVERPLPDFVEAARISAEEQPGVMDYMKLDRALFATSGPQLVAVHLVGDSVAEVYENQLKEESFNAEDTNIWLQQSFQLKSLKYSQFKFYDRVLAEYDPDADLVGAVQRIFNALYLSVDSAVLADLAADPDVDYISAVVDYELDLSETVPYIGASAAQSMGYTGEGVVVGILDSGIDYTHEHFGGAGKAAYDANDPDIIEPGTFPTDKVVGGYDFVGSAWPNGDLAPDPDPLDKPTYGDGHGTHVADIIGGLGGVAPGVDIQAIKVCSSVASSCSGTAIMQGLDYTIDPNGDGKLNDAVDIVNMSLGSPYGNAYYDDAAYAINQATAIGVLNVNSAGNEGNLPYIVGISSTAATALSVAATNVPSAVLPLMEVTAPGDIAGLYQAVFQDWSAPLTEVIEAPLQYGDGAGGYLDGCSLGDDVNSVDPADAPFPPGSLDGKIVLVDRGACNFSVKIHNIQYGGGLAGIIGLVAPGDPFSGAYGVGGPYTIPGYMIHQSTSNMLKDGLPDTVVKFDPDVGVAQVGSMAGYSSRGPSQWLNQIKPEIGAPDASVSAIAGTGDGVSAFGGTSGATPMVAGSAALLKQKMNETVLLQTPAIPFMIKSLLVTNAETEIYEEPVDFFNGKLAPITRIGGGEVRVDRALKAPITLWDQFETGMRFPHLSFGQVDVTGVTQIQKRVQIHNLTSEPLTYNLSSTFRYAEDDTGAVTITLPESVEVSARLPGQLPEGHFDLLMTIDGSKLGDWTMSSGSLATDGDNLTANEYDGYIWLDDTSTTADDGEMIHMPWHVLPRKSGQTSTNPDTLNFSSGVAEVAFTNSGVQVAELDPISWLAHSPQYEPIYGMGDNVAEVDIKDVGVQTYLVPAGFCSAEPSFLFDFVVTTYEPYNAIPWALPTFFIELDVDQDGEDDYEVFNWNPGYPGFSADARNIVWVADLNAGTASAFFYLINTTNSNVFQFLLCGEQIGMNQADLFDPIDAYVLSWDGYFSGYVGDVVDMGTISPYGERYYADVGDVAPGTTETFAVYDFGPSGTNPTELGVLILTGDAALGNESITLAP